MRYWLLFAASVVLSIAGITWGVLSGNPVNGTRGGSVAVMFSFAALFISRGYGAKVYDIIAHQMQEMGRSADRPQGTSVEERIESLKTQLTAMGEQIRLNAEEQFEQNICLALSTVTGTLTWGFGDMATTGLLHSKPVIAAWLCQILNQ
jgi:hypothetical protein